MCASIIVSSLWVLCLRSLSYLPFLPQEIQQDQPIKISSLAPSPSNRGRKCGSRGRPGNAKHFCGWPFEIVVGLQTVYKKRGLPHPERCPLCDQEEENIQHIFTSCVFARQFWFAILQPLNLTRLTPTRSIIFADWWKKAVRKLQKQHRKGFNSLCILGAWTIWKHRNACVFNKAAPNLQVAVQSFNEESHLWQISGAKRLTALNLELGVVQAH